MSDPSAQDRVEDLKAAAEDAIHAFDLIERVLTEGIDREILNNARAGLKRTLERFIADTQPLDVPPPRDTDGS